MVEIEGERVLAASCIRKPGAGHGGAHRQRAGGQGAGDGDGAPARRPAGARGGARPVEPALGHGRRCRGSRRAASRRGRPSAVPLARRQPRGDAGQPRRLHPLQPLRPRLPRGAGERRDRHGRARLRASAIVFDMADPMGASTCVACGECVQACPTGALMEASALDADGARRQPRLRRARCARSAPIAASAARSPTRSGTAGSPGWTGWTARRTRAGSASRGASASTTSRIRTG